MIRPPHAAGQEISIERCMADGQQQPAAPRSSKCGQGRVAS